MLNTNEILNWKKIRTKRKQVIDRTGSNRAGGKIEENPNNVGTFFLQNVEQAAIQKLEGLSLVLLSTTDAATAGARQPLAPHGV